MGLPVSGAQAPPMSCWMERRAQCYFSLTLRHKFKRALSPFLAWFWPVSRVPGKFWRVACAPEGGNCLWLWNFYCCLICSWQPACKVISTNCLPLIVRWKPCQTEKGRCGVAQPGSGVGAPGSRYFHPSNRAVVSWGAFLSLENQTPSLSPRGRDKIRTLVRWESRPPILGAVVCPL